MMQSLHQPSVDFSPASSPLSSSGEVSTIPDTPPVSARSSSRNLLPIFSSARERESESSLSAEYLANKLPAWCANSGSRANTTPSSRRRSSKRSPASSVGSSASSSASSSVSSADNSLLREILKEVQTSNKVADLEKKLQDLQEAECSGSTKRKKLSPSPEVRMMVRKMFKTLEEEEENFGWDISVGFADKANQDIASTLVAEVKPHLPDVPSVTIKEAARTYFNSVSGVSRLKTCGKYGAKIARQRRKNRLLRKLKKRQASFRKTSSLTPAQKETWAPCVVAEMMSSEESDDEDEEDPTFVIRPLLWRSDKVNSFFASLDSKFSKNQSKKSVMMTVHRSKGLPSDRTRPTRVPDWALKPLV